MQKLYADQWIQPRCHQYSEQAVDEHGNESERIGKPAEAGASPRQVVFIVYHRPTRDLQWEYDITFLKNFRMLYNMAHAFFFLAEKRQAISEGRRQPKQIHQANMLNSTGVLTTDDLTENQVQYLIADILKVTKTIVPTLNEKETQRKSSVVRNWSNPSVKNVARNIR